MIRQVGACSYYGAEDLPRQTNNGKNDDSSIERDPADPALLSRHDAIEKTDGIQFFAQTQVGDILWFEFRGFGVDAMLGH